MNRPRILLVDDMPEIIDFCTHILKSDCEIVGSAASGKAAIAAAAITNPDVVVLDISMPGLGGMEVAKRLRSSGNGAQIVFLSSQDDLAKAAIEAGGSAYVSKSRAEKQLLFAIREAIAGRTVVCVGNREAGQDRLP